MFSHRCLLAIVNHSVTRVHHAYLKHFNGKQSLYSVVVLVSPLVALIKDHSIHQLPYSSKFSWSNIFMIFVNYTEITKISLHHP